jgi:hypothetical protein
MKARFLWIACAAAALSAPAFAQDADSSQMSAGGLSGVSTPWDRNATVTGIQTWVTTAETDYNNTMSEAAAATAADNVVNTEVAAANGTSASANNTASSAYNLAVGAQNNDNNDNGVTNAANVESNNANGTSGAAISLASQAMSATHAAPGNGIVQVIPGGGCSPTWFIFANGSREGISPPGGYCD